MAVKRAATNGTGAPEPATKHVRADHNGAHDDAANGAAKHAQSLQPGTVAIHVGNAPDPATGAVVPSLSLSTTFMRGGDHIYARTSNPNRDALEATVAALEGASRCLAYASGMAAITAVFTSGLLAAGDRVVAIRALYGGTAGYLQNILDPSIRVDYVDGFDCSTPAARDLLADQLQGVKLVYVESPTNPTCHLTDLAGLATVTRRVGAKLCVDGTFASPIVTRPLELGADMVVHSATKYLNGHADVTLGVLVLGDGDGEHAVSEALYQKLKYRRNLVGGTPSPFDCYLTSRGLKTLHLRVRQASQTALAIAHWLRGEQQAGFVSAINYAALPPSSSPAAGGAAANAESIEVELKVEGGAGSQYAIFQRQNLHGLGGGMLSFRLWAGASTTDAEAFCTQLRLFKWAVSLGSVESLVEVPGSSLTHRALPQHEREKMGVFDDLVRLSVGCEDTEDLLADLRQALDAVRGRRKTATTPTAQAATAAVDAQAAVDAPRRGH